MTERSGEAIAATGAWLSMGAAAGLLGVSAATLRRWADEGRIVTFTTPGGHRRVARTAIQALLPDAASRPVAVSDLETPARIQRAYRRSLHEVAAAAPFLEHVPSAAREPLRSHGRAIAGSILAYLDATSDDARDMALAEGLIAAAAYGRIAGALGASMRETVALFLRFRTPFVHEMADAARRRGLDTAGTAALLETVTTAIDRLLDATLEGYEAADGRAGRASARRGNAER